MWERSRIRLSAASLRVGLAIAAVRRTRWSCPMEEPGSDRHPHRLFSSSPEPTRRAARPWTGVRLAPNEAAGIKRTRRRRTGAGRREGRLSDGQDGFRKRRGHHPSFSFLWYDLWYDFCKLLFLLDYWRRGWDSNPRYAVHAHTLSRRAPSTARTPLHGSGMMPHLVRCADSPYL